LDTKPRVALRFRKPLSRVLMRRRFAIRR
jgi:hypothetical protein